MGFNRHPRVLIVGTIPYNRNTSSRAFDAYFHNWEKENIRQIFSNTKIPVKGHCSSLFQITDQRMLKKRFGKIDDTGLIFEYDDLPSDWENSDLEVGSKTYERLYKIGSKESALKHLARKWLWKEKFWNTQKLRDWLDDFKPECVFIAFSNDFFILEIALFVAERYNIPIMSCIGEDYYFNDKKSISPFYHIYRKKYKALVRRVFNHGGSAIYIGDKIRDKYNKEFGLNGETVYLTSEIQRSEFKPIDLINPIISYCGNIRVGRNTSLVDIADVLQEINPNYYVDVYSAETCKDVINVFNGHKGIRFHGRIPYKQVVEVTSQSDIVVIVEGFKKQQINTVKYSLSTKAADAMASGKQILVYGDMECGVVEYMASTKCAVVCVEKSDLKNKIKSLLENKELQEQLYYQSGIMSIEHHDKQRNLMLSERLFEQMIEGYNNAKR